MIEQGFGSSTMSTNTAKRQREVTQREILTFGFVRENYENNVPDGVILLMYAFSKLCLESYILNEEEQKYLIKMIEQQEQTKKFQFNAWNLLCSGKRDGNKQKVFHDACDGKENTVCILSVATTGYICGGYASTAWESTNDNTFAKDDNAFLFVIRPIEARKVFHRKRKGDGTICKQKCGLLFHKDDGFNFGCNTFFWGNGYREPTRVYCDDEQDYFEYKSAKDIVGIDKYVRDENGRSTRRSRAVEDRPKFDDFEVFQITQ